MWLKYCHKYKAGEARYIIDSNFNFDNTDHISYLN